MRRLFITLGIVLLLLGLAAGCQWLRSGYVSDTLKWSAHEMRAERYWLVRTHTDGIEIEWGRKGARFFPLPQYPGPVLYEDWDHSHDAPDPLYWPEPAAPDANYVIVIPPGKADQIRSWTLAGFGWCSRATRYEESFAVAAPFWFVTVLPLIAAFLFFRAAARRGRFGPGRCPACGYDLRATSGRCPECGAEPPPPPTPSEPRPAK